MSDERVPRLERILEKTARAVSGGGLHPAEVLQAVEAAVMASVRDGQVANDVRVSFNPADYERYRPAIPELRMEIEVLLEGLERRRNLARIGERMLSFESSTAAAEGRPAVTARFADTSHRALAPPRGATQRITRHRGVALVLGDGTRVPLTHTPFTIGRGPGNDLVLLSLAVSRQHAVIVSEEGRFWLQDLGSRNRISVGGQSYGEVELLPGLPAMLGDVSLAIVFSGKERA